jgi:hypothetical protein
MLRNVLPMIALVALSACRPAHVNVENFPPDDLAMVRMLAATSNINTRRPTADLRFDTNTHETTGEGAKI